MRPGRPFSAIAIAVALRIGCVSAIVVALYLGSAILLARICDNDSIVWDCRFFKPAAHVFTWGLTYALATPPNKWFLFWQSMLHRGCFRVDARTYDYFDLRDMYGKGRPDSTKP